MVILTISTPMQANHSLFVRPGWLFFDLDDTLWDFKGNSIKALHHVYAAFPLIRERFKTYDDFALEYHRHNSRVWEAFAKGEMTSTFIKTERWRATLFPNAPEDFPPEECGKINDEYLSNLASYPDCTDGAEDVLQSLSANHMIAILSNGFSHTQYKKLRSSGLWRLITRVIVSEETTLQKPDPGIFRYAEAETGASGTPVMIGDNPMTDIIGALKAGWNAIWFNPEDKPFPIKEENLEAERIPMTGYLGSCRTLREAARLIESMG